MGLHLQTLIYDPTKGRDTMRVVGDIQFDPKSAKTCEEAAKGFHAALAKYAAATGYSVDYVALWTPDEAVSRGYQRGWMVSWEDGPFEWGINMSWLMTGPWGYTEPHYSFDLCFVEA